MVNDRLNFSYNWNGKLSNNCFTTIRCVDWNKYRTGYHKNVFLKDRLITKIVIIEIRVFKLLELNEWVARLDTGYSREEAIDILCRMYKLDKSTTNKDFMLILCKSI
jgi:hypothetical protein